MLDMDDVRISLAGRRLFGPLSVRVADGTILAVTGPSGSGKSSLLNWILGCLDPAFSASGTLIVKGERRDTLPLSRRRIGILFQDDLLFPHWSVGQNLAFALPARVMGRAARRDRVEQALAAAGLSGFFDRDPATLSGGQKARAGLLRALLNEPDALLLDEPYSRLDAALRQDFRSLVSAEIARLGIPTLLVTHDEADLAGATHVIALGEEQDA